MKISFYKKGVIIFLLFLAAGLVFSSFYGGEVSFVWLYSAILLIPVSFLYILINYKFLSIYQEMGTHRVLKGDEHSFMFVFENEGLLPVHKMQLRTYKDRCMLGDVEDGMLLSLGSFNRKELSSPISCKYAGTYDVGLAEVLFTDPFGIFSVSFDVPYKFRAIVSPRITDSGEKAVDIENIINNTGLKSLMQFEDIPGSDAREYQKGDAVSAINWKLSARLSRIMVRLPERKEKRTLTMIMEAVDVPESKQDTEFLKDRDRFLEFVVSCAYSFAVQGVPTKIVYPSGVVKEHIVNSYESFFEFYGTVADGVFYGTKEDYDKLQEIISNRSSVDGEETVILIREKPSLGEEYCAVI
ncbi:MAG: DUF58 domain-containing protein [Butyrivibrio sp.]|nr:DUF58 domain-containing protein [Butyrivibrio sp.]